MNRTLAAGERVLLIDSKKRRYLVTLAEGGEFHSHAGFVAHAKLIGEEEGVVVTSTRNARYAAFRPTLSDFVLKMPRGAQVIYPKDLGPMLLLADVFPGAHILESGVGSGALSMTLLRAGAIVIGYELRADFAARARHNVESFLGPEVAGHPVWNLRSKTPNNPLVTVPWHQDTAYLAEGAEGTLQPTAWIPLVEANQLNGTLQVVRCGHRSGRVFRHRLENTRGHKDSWYLYIPEDDLPAGEIVTCEMPPGSLLLFNQLLPHRSTENYSDIVRWSIDLRWQRPDDLSGFEGIKNPILMRTGRDPGYRIDWAGWAAQNRIADAMPDALRDEFATSVSGPWMDRWKE